MLYGSSLGKNMDWRQRVHVVLFRWGCFFWSASIVALACRWRLLYRHPQLEPVPATLLQASSLDLMVHGLVGFGLGWIGVRWVRNLAGSFVFAVTVIGILFLTRMGYPLTPELLNQVGGLMEMQTSITGSADYRTWLILAGVFVAFWTLLWTSTRYLKRLQRWLWGSAATATVAGMVMSAVLPEALRTPASHFVHTVVAGSIDSTDLLGNDIFVGMTPQPLERVAIASSGVQRNVVVVVLETFDTQIVEDEQRFAATMPALHALQSSALVYARHYTPWPFSSKALWSLVCGHPPVLNGTIGMRLIPTQDCRGWPQQLADAGYATWAGYSGNLKYDRMGEFFQAQGFQTTWDRTRADSDRFEAFSWGIDDRALFAAFEEWLGNQEDGPFAVLLIPINSHNPFWTPGSTFEGFDDPYRNAFRYQDHLLEGLVTYLHERGLWNNTVLVITGDHGRRESRGTTGAMEEARYLTPLFAFGPDLGVERISFPTSHVDLSGAILGWSGVGGESLDRHDMSAEKPVFVFDTTEIPRYMLVEEGGAFLFAPELSEVYQDDTWVVDFDRACDRRSPNCQRIVQTFMNYIHHSSEFFRSRGIR